MNSKRRYNGRFSVECLECIKYMMKRGKISTASSTENSRQCSAQFFAVAVQSVSVGTHKLGYLENKFRATILMCILCAYYCPTKIRGTAARMTDLYLPFWTQAKFCLPFWKFSYYLGTAVPKFRYRIL